MAGVAQSAQAIADKQVRRSVSAVADYKAGVQAVKVSPAQSAALQVERWFQGLQNAYNSGKFVDACNASTLQSWQEKTLGKGALAYPTGVQNSLQTIVDFHTQRQQHQATIDAQLASMPRGDITQNVQRMVTQVMGMSNFAFKKRRG